MQESKRIDYIDLLRVLALLSVVLCHVIEAVCFWKADVSTLPFSRKIFTMTMYNIGRLGVPVLLMITGFLLLDREYDREATLRFWRHSWLRLLICAMVWVLIYDLFLAAFCDIPLTVKTMLRHLFFTKNTPAGHLWYMPMIVGMYPLIPFAANALRKADLSLLWFPLCFYGMITFSDSTAQMLARAFNHGPTSVSIKISEGFSGGLFGLYIVVGYMLRRGVLKRRRTGALATAAALLFAALVASQIWLNPRSDLHVTGYDNILVPPIAAILFELASRIRRVPAHNAIRGLSRYAFGVYLMHEMFIFLVPRLQGVEPASPTAVIVLWIVITCASFGVVWLLNRIPRVGKNLLYIK